MNRVTICLPYYENFGCLKLQCEKLRALPADLKAGLKLIVVDDGTGAPRATVEDGSVRILEGEARSTAKPAEWENIGFPFELYRILVDVRWNQDAARNIGAHFAKNGWLLLTDMDHLVPERTLRAVMEWELGQFNIYRFERVDYPSMRPKIKNGMPHPHPNSYFMTHKMYWKIGGYDEFYAGHYGTDGEFAERATAIAGKPLEIPRPLARVAREVIPDASTTTYGRKEEIDRDLARLRAIRKTERAADPDWKPLTLSFPYERVA